MVKILVKQLMTIVRFTPNDAQGHILHNMELLWQKYFPSQCVIVRPTGIYGASIDRLKRMAEHTQTYPNIHYSNRIHIDDLARFLVFLADFEKPHKSYLVANNAPVPLHEVLLWFQSQLDLPLLTLDSAHVSGKKFMRNICLRRVFNLSIQFALMTIYYV